MFFLLSFLTRQIRDLFVRAPVFVRFGVGHGPHQSPIRIKAWEDAPHKEQRPSRPWQFPLPQKTVGTTPCPRFKDSQILWLSLAGVQPLSGSRRGRTMPSHLKRVVYNGWDSGQSNLVVLSQPLFKLTAPSQLNKPLSRQRPWLHQRELRAA